MIILRKLLIGAALLAWMLPLADGATGHHLCWHLCAGGSKGIYAYRFDLSSGKSTSIGLVAETPNPTFLAASPDGRFLYAVNEANEYQGEKAGSISAYSSITPAAN